jgi:hypothetical protein
LLAGQLRRALAGLSLRLAPVQHGQAVGLGVIVGGADRLD